MVKTFKTHDDGKSLSVQLRVTRIENGWLVRAGEKPVFCPDMTKVMEHVDRVLEDFGVEVTATEAKNS